MSEIVITGYRPGAIGRITELHGSYYHEHWGLDLFFEARVARDMSEFLLRFNPDTDGYWLATLDDQIVGSIAIDRVEANDEGAHLRWFIVDPGIHSRGIGRRLLSLAVDFCRQREYRSIYLWTFAGLDAARHLYEEAGFKLVDQFEGDQWGTPLTEQRFELTLPNPRVP